MPIYANGILMKAEGFKVYGSRGLLHAGSGGGSPTLSTGAVTVTEVNNALTELASPGIDDKDYAGGYKAENDGDASLPVLGVLCFGGKGTMGAGNKAVALSQGPMKGFNDHDDWLLDGGNVRLVAYQMYYGITNAVYPLNTNGITAIQNAIAWFQSVYGSQLLGGGVVIMASSQGGNILRWLCGDQGSTGLTDPAYVRANVIGAYNGAAELPDTSPDLSGLDIVAVHGDADTTVSYTQNSARTTQINGASTGSPVDLQTVAGASHSSPPLWDLPFNTNRAYTEGVNGYDGALEYLDQLAQTLNI